MPQFYLRATSGELFLGGHEDLVSVERRTSVGRGLTGCIRSLQVNGRLYDLRPADAGIRSRDISGRHFGDSIRGIDIGTSVDKSHCNTLFNFKAHRPQTYAQNSLTTVYQRLTGSVRNTIMLVKQQDQSVFIF